MDKPTLKRMYDDLQELRKEPAVTDQDRIGILTVEILLFKVAKSIFEQQPPMPYFAQPGYVPSGE